MSNEQNEKCENTENAIKCPKCGNKNLHFVNAVIQTGKDFLLLKIVLIITGFCALAMLFVTIAFLSKIAHESQKNWEAFFSYPTSKAFLYFFTAFISDLILIKLIPYKTKNEIRAICPQCGHVEKLSSLIRRQDENAENSENAETEKNNTIERPLLIGIFIAASILLFYFIFLILSQM